MPSPLLQQFNANGFLVLENFNTDAECGTLMKRAQELANEYNYEGHPSIFQTA